MKNGTVVTVVSMLGEVVGRLKGENESTITLGDPRLFVPSPEGNSGGFAPGICMTGQQNLEEIELNKTVVFTMVPCHPEIESGWRQATSGIVA
jgi:hypothetical protein